MDLTNFYFPECRENLVMAADDASNSSLEEDSRHEEDDDSDDGNAVDFVGIKPGDTPYERVIEMIEGNIAFEDISPTYSLDEENKLEWALIKNRIPCFIQDVKTFRYIKVDIITSWYYQNQSRDEEAVKRNLTRSQIDNILYEFKVMSRVMRKQRKSVTCRDQWWPIDTLKAFKRMSSDTKVKDSRLHRPDITWCRNFQILDACPCPR